MSQKMVIFSRHGSRMSGRFILPIYWSVKEVMSQVHNQTSQSYQRRVQLVDNSSTALCVPLTMIPSVSFDALE